MEEKRFAGTVTHMSNKPLPVIIQGGMGAGRSLTTHGQRRILTCTQRRLAAIRWDGGVLRFQARPSLDMSQMIR